MFDFKPHPLVPGGHLQTLAGFYLPDRASGSPPWSSTQHHVEMDDGDVLALHDDCPDLWQTGQPTALMVHGLAGCHRSRYMQRITERLASRRIRVFRMDMRGCGAGEGLAQYPTHCGRAEDLAASLQRVTALCPSSEIFVIGFSLGGAIALNLVADCDLAVCGNPAAVLAVCPPIDLHQNSHHFQRPLASLYDRFFVRSLWRQIRRRAELLPDAAPVDLSRRPRRLIELDEWVTAPLSGFTSAAEYYRLASPGPKLEQIEIPTSILAARDDPVIPIELLLSYRVSRAVEVIATPSGGHLGFVGLPGRDPDLRWLDWRIVDWITSRSRHPVAESNTR